MGKKGDELIYMGKTKKRKNYTKIGIQCFLIFLIGYFTLTFYDQYKEMQSLAIMESDLLSKVEGLQREVDEMKEQIENSGTDAHIEKIAREQLKMVKSGEVIFVDLGDSRK